MNHVEAGTHDFVNKVILTETEKLLIFYANEYKERPRVLLNSFIKFKSIKNGAVLIIFMCRKNGMLAELKGQKDFKEWVNKQPLEEKWKSVFNNFLIILWGCTK